MNSTSWASRRNEEPPLSESGALVDHLFRHDYGRLVAALTRVLGPGRLELAEDAVQDAMVRAMRTWPFRGIPRDPLAWLGRVARNAAVDKLRHERAGQRLLDELAAGHDPAAAPALADDSLRLFFLCCHPALGHESAVTLTLKTLGGLGVPEIAHALLLKQSTVHQRLVRAKERLRGVTFDLPESAALEPRLAAVLDVLYLIFNEGWSAHAGDELVRLELVQEAIRLARMLLQDPRTARPAVHALLGLMLLLVARLPARVDGEGELLTLARQGRALWDRTLLARGMHHFERSIAGDELTPFHVEASIASLHALAPDYAATDWQAILQRYDTLVALTGSPVARLNRAIAIAKVHGAQAALQEIERLEPEPALAAYHLLPSVRGMLLWTLGRHADAAAAFRAALPLAVTTAERALLERRIAASARGSPAEEF